MLGSVERCNQAAEAVTNEHRRLGVAASDNLVDEFPNGFKVILEALDMPSFAWRPTMARKIKGIDRVPLFDEPLRRFSVPA